jgi:hypothetical protein
LAEFHESLRQVAAALREDFFFGFHLFPLAVLLLAELPIFGAELGVCVGSDLFGKGLELEHMIYIYRPLNLLWVQA